MYNKGKNNHQFFIFMWAPMCICGYLGDGGEGQYSKNILVGILCPKGGGGVGLRCGHNPKSLRCLLVHPEKGGLRCSPNHKREGSTI